MRIIFGRCGVYVRVVGDEELLQEVVQFGGDLNPRRAAPDDDEGELGVGDFAPRQRRLLVAIDDAVADLLPGPDAPYAYGVLFDAGDPEVRGLRPRARVPGGRKGTPCPRP